MQHKVIKTVGLGTTIGLALIATIFFSRTGASTSVQEIISGQSGGNAAGYSKDLLANQIGASIRNNEYPSNYQFNVAGSTQSTKVQYTIHEPSQAMMKKILGQYKPDYGAFVAMDAKTGRILAMVSHSAARADGDNLALKASFPAASIFKVVTASAALDLDKANPETVVPFNGALHTLYKRNLESTEQNRWTRKMTMREAFARSVNVFFAKLGLFYVGPQNLHMYAERFLFNHPIHADIPVQTGYARFSLDDPFSVASAASGFTRETTMSPIQGALIAAAVANDGVMMEPYIIDALQADDGRVVYQGEQKQASVVFEPRVAEGLRELFYETVRAGTSRKSFRQIVRRSSYGDVEFGGKTGSLTGKDPAGKCDWFVGYARYHDQRIAVAALTVNERKWKVKSSMLANLFFQNYLKDVKRAERMANNAD